MIAGERRLVTLGALESTKLLDREAPLNRITELGRTLALLPVTPAYGASPDPHVHRAGKLIVLASQHAAVLPHAIALVAALSVREPWAHLPPPSSTSCASERSPCTCEYCAHRQRLVARLAQRRAWSRANTETRALGDCTLLLRAFYEADKAYASRARCDELGVRRAAMLEIRRQRRQLVSMLTSKCLLTTSAPLETADASMPTAEQCRLLRQCIVTALADKVGHARGLIYLQIAIRASLVPHDEDDNVDVPTTGSAVTYRTRGLMVRAFALYIQ